MPNDKLYLCSDLVAVSSASFKEVAQLEMIGPETCCVIMQSPLPVGTRMEMQCLECPRGEESCTRCRFAGHVRENHADPLLGASMRVDFEGRGWSAEEWRPRHLTGI